ncbi:MAG: SlyX family protein [Planctomycetota bacterium]
MESRLTQLEELLAHQQRLLDELNEVITTQRREIDWLLADREKLKATVTRLVQLQESAEQLPDERPPHY